MKRSADFKTGDLVKVVREGNGIGDKCFIARVKYSYYQEYGHGDKDEWSVTHPQFGSLAWVSSSEMTLIKSGTDKDELAVRRLEDKGKVR